MGGEEIQSFVLKTSFVTFVSSWIWAYVYFTQVTPVANSPFENMAFLLLILSWTFLLISLAGLIIYLIIQFREKDIDIKRNKERMKRNTMITLLLIFSPGALLFLMYAATFILISTSIFL